MAKLLAPKLGDLRLQRFDGEQRVEEEAGFVVGRNVMIEYRFADGREERLPLLASDLVRRLPTLLIATDRPSAGRPRRRPRRVGEDPVQLGLVASLNRLGGNATGMSVFTTGLGPKRLGLLREVMPKPGLIAFLVNPNTGTTPQQLEGVKAAAQSVAQPLAGVPAGTEAQVDAAFATMAQSNVARIVYSASPFFQVVRP